MSDAATAVVVSGGWGFFSLSPPVAAMQMAVKVIPMWPKSQTEAYWMPGQVLKRQLKDLKTHVYHSGPFSARSLTPTFWNVENISRDCCFRLLAGYHAIMCKQPCNVGWKVNAMSLYGTGLSGRHLLFIGLLLILNFFCLIEINMFISAKLQHWVPQALFSIYFWPCLS